MAADQIAVIGSGGKTTAMELLARQSGARSVLVTTTTHIFPMNPPACRECLIDPDARQLADALARSGIVCAGRSAKMGKLSMLPEDVLFAGMAAADLMIYEADGSRGLPLKLHRADEPVLLPGVRRCLVVAGLSALSRPVGEVIHRHELQPGWEPQRIVGREEFLHCVRETAASSGLPKGMLRIWLNQRDALPNAKMADEIVEILRAEGFDARSGSLRDAPDGFYDWVTGECHR